MQKNKGRRLIAAALAVTILTAFLPVLPTAAAAYQSGPLLIDTGGRALSARTFCAEQARKTGLAASLSGSEQSASADGSVRTGQTLILSSKNGSIVSRREIAVRGDVIGAGAASLSQLARIAQSFCGSRELTQAERTAADFNGSGELDLADLVSAARQLQNVQNGATPSLTSKVLPWYFRTPEDATDTAIYFLDGNEEIAFLSMDTVEALIRSLLEFVGDTDLTRRDESGVTVFERASGSRVTLSFEEGTITFSSFNEFLLPTYAATMLDPLNTSGLTQTEESWYFLRSAGSFERVGHPVVLDLKEAGISMPAAGESGYIPLQTFSDFFLAPFGFQAVYNGQMVGIVAGDLEELSDLYYAVPPRPRSEALANFMYRELCLVLDSYYGLKEQHDITSFDALFEQTGLKADLTGTDAEASDRALYELAVGYLGDLHTSFLSTSSYTGKDAAIRSNNISASVRDYHASRVRFEQARIAAYPGGVPGYEEIANTAYITIDGLSWQGYDYYDTPPTSSDTPDTIGLICYAHQQITREGSPVENVVLDLSSCGGGLVDAAIYVLGWFCGSARLDLNDTMTGAQASTVYQVDVNLDGQFTQDDTITSKNRYCLISPLSFSCGNIIPAVLKQDPLVTLIGQESGGGACLVLSISTADGSLMQLSGPMRASRLTNGSYYDIDTGIIPEIHLALPEQFYDRDTLTERISTIFR